MAVTGAILAPILERLNSANRYHPFEAETFSDWATEAGDQVSISRDGTEYVSPVHTTRMIWKGTPEISMSSTGQKERDPIAKVSKRKYGRGSAGIRNNEQIHRNFFSEDGILHSELHITESYLRTEFHNESDSLRSYFDMTSSHMRTEFIDEVHSLRGDFEVTVSHMRTEFTDDVNSLRGEFEVTVSHMRTEFVDDVNSLRGDFEVTVSHMRTEFTDDVNSLRGEFEVTVSHMRTEFTDDVNSLRGEFEVTVSHMRTEFVDDVNSLRGDFEVTVSHMRTEFTDEVNSVRGDFEVTVSHMRTEFIDEVSSLRGEFEVTSSHMRTEFEDEINSVRSYTEQTASSWETRVEGVVDANGNVTAASIALAVNNAGSSVKINANKIYLLGQTIADTIDADYISSAIAEIPHLYTNHITMDGDLTLGGRLWLLGVNVTSLVSGVKSVRISDPVNNTYKLQYTTYDDDSWQDAGSFSRATTLTGSWGGTVAAGKSFTVTASPQGNIKAGKVYGEIVPDTSDPVDYTVNGNNHYVARDYIIYSEDENGDADVQILKKEVKISADLAYSDGYTTGYEEGSASGGSTTLTNTWNNGHLVVTANPQGEVLERWLSSGTPTFSGTLVSIPVNALFGNSQQYSESTGWSASANISSLLQSKTVTSNGTVTPGSGYIGLSSVTVNVPTTNARAHFGATSGQYYIEAVDTVSGNPIPDSSVNYSLVASGSNVTISAGSGQTVPSIALGINSGSLSNGSRTLTVTAGGSNTTATVTITDYSAGWTAAYGKVSLPANNTETGFMVVETPPSTVGGNATSTTYTLDTADKNIAYIKQGSSVKAQVTHNKYNSGWAAAYGKVSLPANNTETGFMVVETPPSTVDGNATSTTYTLDTADKNIAYIKQGSSVKAQVTHNKYNSGWTAAYNKVTLPANGTGTTMVVETPPSTVDGNATSTTYTLSSDNNVAYIKVGNDVKAKLTHNKYSNGYTAGWHAYYNTMHFPSSGTTSTMSVYWPGYTPDSSWDSVQRNYVLQNKDDNTVYLRYSNVTYAQFAHNKYYAGKAAVTLNNASWNEVSNVGISRTVSVTTKDRTKDDGTTENLTKSVGLYLTQGSWSNNKIWVYMREGSSSGTARAQVQVDATSIYDNGKANADHVITNYSTNSPSGASVSVSGTTYTNSSKLYAKSGSGANATVIIVTGSSWKCDGVSRTQNAYNYLQTGPTNIWKDAYAEGVTAGASNAPHTITNYSTTSPINASIVVGDTTYTNSSKLYAKSGSGRDATVIIVTGSSWKCDGISRTQNAYNYLRTGPTNIWKDAYDTGYDANHSLFIGDTNYNAKPGEIVIQPGQPQEVWAYFKKSDGTTYQWSSKYTLKAGSTSHSISQSHAYADNLATLANNLGASSSSSLTDLGTFPAAGGRNYWGIKVSCGSAVKYYYVHTT